MDSNWREMIDAPRNEPVLVCLSNCDLLVGIQKEHECSNEKGKRFTEWHWLHHKNETRYYNGMGGAYNTIKPKMWQPLPLPPKHLYERKLTADLLEKQIAQLRDND